MSFIAAAIIGGGLGLVGAAISSRGARSAAQTQANAADRSADVQQYMYNTTREDQAPWRQAGGTSLAEIMRGFGLGPDGNPGDGYFGHRFDANDLNANLAPNYEFMRQQGEGAVRAEANRMGGLGANSLAAISKFNTGYAQQGYQQAYANYTANQTNIFNRLSAIAGLGQTAGSNQSSGGSTYAGNIGNSIMGAGNAAAAGQVGSANAWSSGLSGLGNMYMLSSFLRPPAGG